MGWIVTWFERLGTPFTTSGTEALPEFETLGMVYATKSLVEKRKNQWRGFENLARPRGESLSIASTGNGLSPFVLSLRAGGSGQTDAGVEQRSD